MRSCRPCRLRRSVPGRAGLQALEHGFKRAYATIFDSNAATFLSHVMLFVFGSGPVKGFDVTITIGIATSMFTAWMLTRLLVSQWYIAVRPRLLPVERPQFLQNADLARGVIAGRVQILQP